MENWGLITYKEQYLIGNENSHPRDILEILLTVAHELAHQFYGNVVTCKWWDQIWLNEGFATLFEYLLVDNVYPEDRLQHYMNVKVLQYALRSDAKETSRAMLKYVETPSEIGDLFDDIAYDKGDKISTKMFKILTSIYSFKAGSVIRMFQNAVGEGIFRDSLSLYLSNK
jgi:aminopeptidase N